MRVNDLRDIVASQGRRLLYDELLALADRSTGYTLSTTELTALVAAARPSLKLEGLVH